MSIRILLANDHKIIREALRALLVAQPEIEVVAEAEDGGTAVQLARESSPDVILMDIHQGDVNGVEATLRIAMEMPDVKIIALTTRCDKQYVAQMLRAGASGYVLKDCALDELDEAIRTVAKNQYYLDSKISQIVVEGFLNEQTATAVHFGPTLTPREREVIRYLAQGKSTKEVAHHLQLSPKTIERHRSNVMRKLNIRKSAELIRYAIMEGLVPMEA